MAASNTRFTQNSFNQKLPLTVITVSTAISEMSSQIIPLKGRTDLRESSRISARETCHTPLPAGRAASAPAARAHRRAPPTGFRPCDVSPPARPTRRKSPLARRAESGCMVLLTSGTTNSVGKGQRLFRLIFFPAHPLRLRLKLSRSAFASTKSRVSKPSVNCS